MEVIIDRVEEMLGLRSIGKMIFSGPCPEEMGHRNVFLEVAYTTMLNFQKKKD
jgi:hypothetical protein